VDVRVSAQNGVSGNSNNVSRLAGYGQPCNLPGSEFAHSIDYCLPGEAVEFFYLS
jgi:hypothetical protein